MEIEFKLQKWQPILTGLMVCVAFIIGVASPQSWVVCVVLLVVLFCISWIISQVIQEKCPKRTSQPGCDKCSISSSSSPSSNLLPILETNFNLRECAKQMILLEDHLNNSRKDCVDCKKKHMLTIEGLAEEGTGLNGSEQSKQDCEKTAQFVRDCEQDLISGVPNHVLSQKIRSYRKELMSKYF